MSDQNERDREQETPETPDVPEMAEDGQPAGDPQDRTAAAPEAAASGTEPAETGAPQAADEAAANEQAAGEQDLAGESPAGDDSMLEEEQRIRQELGIGGGKVEADAEVIDQLLEGAVIGYESIFQGTALDAPRSSRDLGLGMAATSDAGPVEENLHLLRDVHMKVKVELGRGQMYLKDILRLGQGSVVELDRLAGDPLDIYVNDKVIARGEVLVLNENFCIRITEIYDAADVLREA